MFDQVTSDIKKAMKAKEKGRLNALRYLKSLLLENKTSKSPKAELDVVVAHQKKLKDSMQAYPTESEQRQKISEEIEFLKPYLPTPMTEEDVRKIILEILSKNGKTPYWDDYERAFSSKSKESLMERLQTRLFRN